MKKRAVIIKYGFLGDSIVCIPFLSVLKRTHTVDLITISWLPPGHSLDSKFIFKSLDLVDNVISLKKEPFYLLKLILGNYKKYHDCFNLLPSLGLISNLFYSFIGRSFARNYFHRNQDCTLPEVMDILSLASDSSSYKVSMEMFLHKICARSLLRIRDRNSRITPIVIGVQPFSKMSSKQFDLNSFNYILTKIHSQYSVRYVFLGTKFEYLNWDFKLVEFLENNTLEDLFKVISDIDIYFGVDTGAMHIADIFGKKVIALFSDRTRDRNWYPSVSSKVYIHRSFVPCGGCNLVACDRDNECLKLIDTEEVIKSIEYFCND